MMTYGRTEMLKIQDNSNQIEVIYNDRPLMTFKKERSLVAGIGRDQYVMKHGAFKFKEKVNKIVYGFDSLSSLSAKKDGRLSGEPLYKLRFNSMNHRIDMIFSIKEENLFIKFNYTDKRINRIYLDILSTDDEYPYGCGEQFASLNLKNKKVKNWVSEHVALSSLLKKAAAYQFNRTVGLLPFEKYASYMVQPTFITSKKMFLHLNADSYSHFVFNNQSIEIEVREQLKSLVIGMADDYETLMMKLTHVVGRQPRLPEWVFDGMMLGIQDGTFICNEKMHLMKKAGAKINGIWAQDWEGQRITKFGKQLMWDWIYDKDLYDRLPQYIKKWEEEEVRFLGYINPFLAIEGDLYKEASNNGYLVLNSKGEDYLVTITTFPAAMIDLTNPAACEFMKNVIKEHMIGIGLKGWMADFAEYLPTDSHLYSGEDPRLVHNTWPVRWAKLNEEAINESDLREEIFFFVRAGYTGTGKHAKIMWNGDQHVDWTRDYGIGSIVNSGLSLGMTGIGNSHSDIGGYTTFGKMTRSKELLMRWTEMSSFSMIMRSHEGNQPEKNHQFDSDEETINHVARFTRIYHHLKPYHLALDTENANSGIPSQRPLFFYYDQEEFFHLDQVYLLGRDLLVYPVVTKGQNQMTILLPEDQWIHGFTGEVYQGGQVTINCPIGQPVVFYRMNSEFTTLFEGLKDI